MGWDENTRFGITPWPGIVLPQPRFVDRMPLLLTESGRALVVDGSQEWPDEREHHETYLRLCELDLEDERAILRFACEYGPMGVHWQPGRYTGGTHYVGFRGPGFDEIIVPRLRAGRDRVAADGEWPYHYSAVETLDEFRWGATCLRDLVRAWRFVSEGVQPSEWECPIWEANRRVHEHDARELAELYEAGPGEADDEDEFVAIDVGGPPTNQAQAAALLSRGIRDGLTPFHPQLVPNWRIENGQDPYGPLATIPLYFFCCLEIYNHVVDQAPYKTCASEACGRMFVRQEGRAVHGQHRTTGVKYCSSECARAQAQRAYRRRKRAGGSPEVAPE